MALIPPFTHTLRDNRLCLIRPAEPSDAQAHLDQRVRNWRDASLFSVTNPAEYDGTVEKEALRIQEVRDSPDAINLAAFVDNNYIGGIHFRAGERRRIAHHGHFGIGLDKAFWNQGVGAALIRALIDWATAHPTIERLDLGVFANNPRAIHLYTKLGFTENFRRFAEFKYEDGTYCDDIQMSLWVKPKPQR